VTTAIVTGALGQDGFHLVKLLTSKGYSVIGVTRSLANNRKFAFNRMFPEIPLLTTNLLNLDEVAKLIAEISPREIYNLAGFSSVVASEKDPQQAYQCNSLIPLNILLAIKNHGDSGMRFYQSSSSEMFGNTSQVTQDESSPINPRNIYGATKAFAHQNTRIYRENYSVFSCSGILYNHESEFRSSEYVTRKIISGLVRIKRKEIGKFSLGNLDARRDWGYAGDYVRAMWLMLQNQSPADYVVASGQLNSVRDFLLKAMYLLDLGDQIEKYVSSDTTLNRDYDKGVLCGDTTKITKDLNWRPAFDFSQLVERMVLAELKGESI